MNPIVRALYEPRCPSPILARVHYGFFRPSGNGAFIGFIVTSYIGSELKSEDVVEAFGSNSVERSSKEFDHILGVIFNDGSKIL